MYCVNESRLASVWLRNPSAVPFYAISNYTLVGDVCTTGCYTVTAFWSQNIIFYRMLGKKKILQKQLHWSCHLYKEFMYFIVRIYVFLISYWIALIQIQTWFFLLDVLVSDLLGFWLHSGCLTLSVLVSLSICILNTFFFFNLLEVAWVSKV